MHEVEGKYRVRDLESVRTRLIRRGAEPLTSGTEVDIYFQAPHRDFAATDEALRLRHSGTGWELTYKGPRVPAGRVKAREEITLPVDAKDACIAILSRIGFVPAAEVRKHRDTYRLSGATVTLDQVEGLGEYVEIEVISSDTGAAGEVIEEVRRELEIEGRNIHRSYLELILERR